MNLGYLVVRFFLNSGNLICRSTGISMYFRESLGVRDNESRLYSNFLVPETKIAEFANRVDLDEVAHHEPPHLDLHCLPLNSEYSIAWT